MKRIMRRFLPICLMFSLLQLPGNAVDGAQFSGKKQINSFSDTSGFEVSEPMTFEEVSFDLAQTMGISLEEAKRIIDPAYSPISGYSVNASGFSYRTLSSQFTVTALYKPSVKFYCKTSEGTSAWGIVEIINAYMNREYDGMSKQFEGELYVNLESAYQIHYIVNGDFYDNGTTTVTFGVPIPVGGGGVVTFGVTYSSNHYAYCLEEKTVDFAK